VGIVILFLITTTTPITFGYNIKLQRLETTKLQSTNRNRNSKTVILVDDEGDGDYTSIQDAIDNATAGDTIEVYSGTYAENVLINKTLNLYGIDYELGSGDDEGMPMVMKKDTETIFTVTADGCNISGFDFKKIEYTHEAISIYHSDNNNIFGNSLSSNTGVHLFESYYNNVYDNELRDCNRAISLVDSEYNKIYENHISDSVGIRLHYHSDYNFVYKNIIEDCIVGIEHWQSENNTVFDNVIIGPDGWMSKSIGISIGWDDYGTRWSVYGNQISNYGKGIEIRSKYHKIYRNNISDCDYGIITDRISYWLSTNHLDIYENNIKNCKDSGIRLKGVFSSNIYRNNITGNKFGMEIWESVRNNIFENNIKSNERIGMWVWYSEDNLIYHNNFINSDRNVDLIRDKWPNTWNLGYTNDGGGNYWSDYKGKDKNGDGVGDTPYIIPDNDNNPRNDEKDMYPLMEPDGRPNSRIYPVNRLLILRYRFLERFSILERLLELLGVV